MGTKRDSYLEMRPGLRFLFVDSNNANYQAFRTQLKKFGYNNIVAAESTYEALKNFQTAGEGLFPEFVICRHDIEPVSGLEMLEELKNNLSFNRVPTLIFDTDWDKADVALVLEKGADAFLTVPYVSKDLAAKISQTWSKYIDPSNIEFQFEKARRFFVAGQLEESLKAFQAIEQAGKIVSRVRVAIGRTLKELERPDEAIALCKKVLAVDPENVHALQLLGECCLDEKDYVPAIQYFAEAINLSPKNPWRYDVISEILINMGLWDHTIGMLKLAESVGLTYDFINERLAKSYLELSQFKKAIKRYKRLVEIKKDCVPYLNNIAVCYKKLEDQARSVFYYKKALEIEPENTKIMFNLALAFLGNNNSEKGESYLNEILKADPGHEKASMKLLQLKDPEGWKKEKERLKTLTSDSSDISQAQATSVQKLPQSLAEEDLDKITLIINRTSTPAKSAKVVHMPGVRLSPENLAKLHGAPDLRQQQLYVKAMLNVRKKFFRLMKAWLAPIEKISEELVTDILHLTGHLLEGCSDELNQLMEDIRKKSETDSEVDPALFKELSIQLEKDSELRETIYPIMQHLQFQDYIRQIIDIIKKSYKRTYATADGDAVWKDLKSLLIQQSDKQLFFQTVHGKDLPEDELVDDSSNIILF